MCLLNGVRVATEDRLCQICWRESTPKSKRLFGRLGVRPIGVLAR